MTESPSRTVAALRSFCGLIDAANLAGAMVAAASCALLAVMLIAEVATTSLFAWSQPWAVEYGAYLCAFTLMAGSGYALRHGTHIRVMLILEYSPRRMRRPVELFCTLGALAVATMLTWGLG
ncbi:MAG: TRAP transporter small permease subunit [Betaproteobacteria bacterium]